MNITNIYIKNKNYFTIVSVFIVTSIYGKIGFRCLILLMRVNHPITFSNDNYGCCSRKLMKYKYDKSNNSWSQLSNFLRRKVTLMESQLEIKHIWYLVLRLTVVFQMIGGSIIWIMIHGTSYQIFQEMAESLAIVAVGIKYMGAVVTRQICLIGGNMI